MRNTTKNLKKNMMIYNASWVVKRNDKIKKAKDF